MRLSLRPLVLCWMAWVWVAVPLGAQQVVRYHLGALADDSWASATYEDGSWSQAPASSVPLPQLGTDGVLLLRIRLAVPSTSPFVVPRMPLAVQLGGLPARDAGNDLWVDGWKLPLERGSRVGVYAGEGAEVVDLPVEATAGRGAQQIDGGRQMVVVALRLHLLAVNLFPARTLAVNARVDSAPLLHAEWRTARLQGLLGESLDIAICVLLALGGLVLLVVGRRLQSRELLLGAATLLSFSPYLVFGNLARLGVLMLTPLAYWLVMDTVRVASMLSDTEFCWEIYKPGSPWPRWVLWFLAVVYNVFGVPARLMPVDSAHVVPYMIVLAVLVRGFQAAIISLQVWSLFARRGTRLFAVAFIALPVSDVLGALGLRMEFDLGPFHVLLFDASFYLVAVALLLMLARRGWAVWRQGEELRGEFDAAHELQQRLVPAAHDLPGYRIASAYEPAKQVGGDFFWLRRQDDGGLTVVVGDVSGKGLRAAMTVAAVVGALRTMPPLAPAAILTALNRGLVGELGGGFVTCCAALIELDGTVTLANGGHLLPYCDGVEIAAESGLPLGVVTGVNWSETQFQLGRGQQLTFVSDGIVEARDVKGELFGFERTQQLARGSAVSIAEAAIAFGQDDDISVLTVAHA